MKNYIRQNQISRRPSLLPNLSLCFIDQKSISHWTRTFFWTLWPFACFWDMVHNPLFGFLLWL